MTRKGNVLYKCQWTAKKIYISTGAEIEGEQNVKVRNGVHSVRINAFAHLEWNYLYLCEIWWEQLLQNSRLISSTPNRCIILYICIYVKSDYINFFPTWILHKRKSGAIPCLVLGAQIPPPNFFNNFMRHTHWGLTIIEDRGKLGDENLLKTMIFGQSLF